MRSVSRVPAQQLRSVSARYRCPNVPRGGGAPRHLWWRVPWYTQRDGMARDSDDTVARRQRVEAVLLLSREPLNSRKLAHYARLADGTEARTIVRQLNRLYDDAGRAFRAEEVAGGFRLLTRRQFAPWLRRLDHVPPLVRLSAPAMETLAVVAYRQPVVRAEIEAIRGVNCGEILRQLMERDLVRIAGRSDELGRPYLYTTTKRFLQLFGLQNLNELPRAVALREGGGAAGSSNSQPSNSEFVVTPVSPDEPQQEQEKSEVSVTSPNQLPVDEMLQQMSSMTVASPRNQYDSDADDDYDVDDEEYEDEDDYEEDYDDDVEEDDVEEDEAEEDEAEEDDEDGFEEDEWEEVEDDEEEEDGDWEEEEEWEDDYDDDEEEYDDDEEEEDGDWE